jgi:hypothetical protein
MQATPSGKCPNLSQDPDNCEPSFSGNGNDQTMKTFAAEKFHSGGAEG